jgi:hypothetical protein
LRLANIAAAAMSNAIEDAADSHVASCPMPTRLAQSAVRDTFFVASSVPSVVVVNGVRAVLSVDYRRLGDGDADSGAHRCD